MRPYTFAVSLLALAVLLAGCGQSSQEATPSPVATQTPSPTPIATASPTQVKYALMDQFGDIFFCDPDFYPVAREGQEQANAISQFPAIQQNTEEFQAILQRLGLQSGSDFSSDQKLAIYREHKRLRAVQLDQTAEGYHFSLRVGQNNGFAIEGTVSRQGAIAVTKKDAAFNTCPICLSGDAEVATPAGSIHARDVRAGMQVWTLGANGDRVAATVLKTVERLAPIGSEGVLVRLADGREVLASAGHPSAEGRPLGSYHVGDALDGSTIIAMDAVPFPDGATYDLLPSGPTGVYWVNGIALKSTLGP